MTYYVLELMQDNPTASVVVVGVGDSSDAAKTDCIEYYNSCDKGIQDATFEGWQDMAGDSGCELYVVELAVLPQEWQVKPRD